jgi:glycosyltransferase involved in cell wall biosynthesis
VKDIGRETAQPSICIFTKFHPSIGGIETLTDVLARNWTAAGHRVTVVTDVADRPGDSRRFPFPIVRNPGPADLLRLVRGSDLVLHQNISLKMFWPLLFLRRPLVAVHHGTYCGDGRRRPWREAVKVWIARHWAHSASVSRAVKERVGCSGPVIPNCYDDAEFYNAGRPRGKDLIFLGRLVSDKGANVLLDALGKLRQQGMRPTLTIIGDGPERTKLVSQIQELQLEGQVRLAGWQSQKQIASALNEHKILVVPSVWNEPFGIVALEGAACGCVIVGSEGGGLPEAIGPCGVTFPNGDHRRLAAILSKLLANPERLEEFRRAAPAHLVAHRAEDVSAKYLAFFESVLELSPRRALLPSECPLPGCKKSEHLESHVG